MLEPLELRSYPSCSNCLSWSADGEVAVAAGEIVYVLVCWNLRPRSYRIGNIEANSYNKQSPKPSKEEKQQDQAAQRPTGSQWDISKLKTNAFTLNELPLLLPEPGTTFSLGEEQSASHAVSVAWSSPRLAVYGKCMLAVLTSNLTLSLWHAVDGASRWNRTLIVNHALRKYFKTIVRDDSSMLRRKQRIRAFSWSYLSLQATQEEVDDKGSRHGGGIHFLIVSNDTNDIVVLRVTAPSYGQSAIATVLSHYSLLPQRVQLFQLAEQSSLFAELSSSRATITTISSSVWIKKLELEAFSASVPQIWKVLIAFTYGSKLEILHLETEITATHDEPMIQRFELYNKELSLQYSMATLGLKGPLHWLETTEDDNILWLAAGIMNGFIVITIPKDTWAQAVIEAKVHKEKFDASFANWHPISGFASRKDGTTDGSLLYTTTLSSLHLLGFPTMETQIQQPTDDEEYSQSLYLKKEVESFRDRFDLDYDLSGMSTAKSWGLCSYRGWIATCATFHPTDMVQHTTSSQERMTLFFAPPGPDRFDHTKPGMPWHMPATTPGSIQESACKVIQFTLKHRPAQLMKDPWAQKLLYAAACSVIVYYNSDPRLVAQAQEVMQALADEPSVDLSLEMTLLDELLREPHRLCTRTISPKTKNQLKGGAGSSMFEKCDICDSGIEWYSPVESQCAEGHLFARCALTFLSIQDPSISKRCSRCERECFDNTSAALGIEGARGLLGKILGRFDECVYCGSRFKA
ncbi:hypothetical protein MaudMau93_006212 [Microsporum audouinii]